MTALDWFIVIVLVVGFIRGFAVGAVRQVASLVGLVIGFFLSVQLMDPVGALIASSFGLSEAAGPIVGFVVLFVGIQLLFFIVSRLLEQVLDLLSLSLANRAAGGALGGVKAALLLSVLFLVLSGVEMPAENTRDQSVLYSPVAGVLPKTLDVASPYLPAAERASNTFGTVVRSNIQPESQQAAGSNANQ